MWKIFFFFMLSVRLEELPATGKNNQFFDDKKNSEASKNILPRKLNEFNTDDAKRKLALMAQNMQNSPSLPSSNPYSIQNSATGNNNDINSLLTLQKQQLGNQQLQNQISPSASKFRRRDK